jgi:hypothetical protein
MKCDLGFRSIICLASLLVGNQIIAWNIVDCTFVIFQLVNIYMMRMAVIYINLVKKRDEVFGNRNRSVYDT